MDQRRSTVLAWSLLGTPIVLMHAGLGPTAREQLP